MKRIAVLAICLVALCAADASAFAPRGIFRARVGLGVFRPRVLVVNPGVANLNFRQRAFIGHNTLAFRGAGYGYGAQQLGFAAGYGQALSAPLPCQQALSAPAYAAPLAAGTCGNALGAPLGTGCGSAALSAPLGYGAGFHGRNFAFRVRGH